MKRYRIISELGKGATGVVYRAVRSGDGVTVALKKLVLPGHLDAHEEEEFIRRFKSEAEAALTMDHPNVVKCLDCGLDEGTFYIAYELIEGITLEEAMESGRELSPEEVADILVQSSEALSYAHERGVIHRDISPGNIFLGDDGKVRISDFGVARFTSRSSLGGEAEAIVGTPGYMAPEQTTGGDADPRSDVFSLGCVAYELLAHERAFTGDSIAQLIHQTLNVQPRPVRDRNPKVPLALEEVVFRMLAKNPDYRYQSMDEVQAAAQRVLEEIPRARKAPPEGEAGRAPALVCVKGPHEGERFTLLPTVTTIGRRVGDVLLPRDEAVAPQHAWITREETGWVLYDADSESGTFLNGERIERDEVLPGDRIMVGETVFEFRGAGGHAGAFQEEAAEAEAAKPGAVDKKTRVSWVLIVVLSLPGVIVLAALIVLGAVLPRQYMAALDNATEYRWDSAYAKLDENPIGSLPWDQDAGDILTEWLESPLGAPSQFKAPTWVLSRDRIDKEVDYRFALFGLTEDFLNAVGQPIVADSVSTPSPLATVRGLETRVDSLAVPGNVAPAWQGRKHQLLALIRRWIASGIPGGGTGGPPVGYQSERNTAVQHLLNGWHTYRAASGDMTIMEEAFNEFQLCRMSLDPVLEAAPGDHDALAVRGLATFLAARILRQAGSSSRLDRYERALAFLDDAEQDMSGVRQSEWDRAIPRDFMNDFPSPGSVRAQIAAQRLAINNLLERYSGEESTSEIDD